MARYVIKMKIRTKLIFIAVCFFLLLMVGVHFWIADRSKILRLLYPLEATVVQFTIDCSGGSPNWLEAVMRHAISSQSSLSNQLVYISPDKSVSHCESGWKGRIFFSSLVDPKTRFRYASLTKVLTADVTLRQVRAGHLSLGATLANLVPHAFPSDDLRLSSITVENLLNHSAGFDRLKSSDVVSVHNKKPWCPYELSHLSSVQLDFTPGEQQIYSNLGYCLLGAILERTVKKPFRELVNEEYSFDEFNIRFVDGPYYSDEVSYDFRNSSFYGDNYSQYFDFYALSSSAGLSGSALSLATLVSEKIMTTELPNITSADDPSTCKVSTLDGCFGYGLSRYQLTKNSLSVHTQRGFLYGVSGVLLVDSKGGVTVWLGNGMNLEGTSGKNMTMYMYNELDKFYKNIDRTQSEEI